ncbi:hypothetical protein CR513_02183, partial [Mucuna pruriens]
MTARTKIDVHVGTLLMEFGDTLVQFNIFKAMKHPTEDHSLFGIDLIDELVEECLQRDNSSEGISDFAGDTKAFDCIGSIIDEADYDKATKTNDVKVIVDFLKSNIFCRFSVPKLLISDQGSQFCNKVVSALLHKYGVTNSKAKVFNKEIKKTLQKMVNPSRKDWSRLLENALWEHKTAYRTLLGMSPYRIVFGKTCHLLVEIEHRAYWAVKQCNLAHDQADKQRKLQLQELEELRLKAYENSQIYKQKVKQFHDHQILRKEFQVDQKVLLFNSRLKLIAGKLHFRWDEPFVITNVFPYGVVELKDEHTNNTF